jgi:TonB family protein
MRKFLGFFCLFLFVFSSSVYAIDQDDFVIKSRLFKSTEQDTNQESDVVVSLFSVPVLIPYHPNYIQLEKINIHNLKNDLQKIYKIEYIDHIASGLMLWDGNRSNLDGIIMVKESSYPMFFSPSMLEEGGLNLRVQVSQPRDSFGHPQSEGDLLDTEMVMRVNTPYVLGFPSDGNKYFLAISIAKKEAGTFQEDEYSQAGPEQDIPKTPTPVHKIIPTYPLQCKQENIGGKVILQVSIDKQGAVTQVKILNSPHSDLGKAAADAIEQWKFQPIIKKNKPISAKFPIIVDFKTKVPSENQRS